MKKILYTLFAVSLLAVGCTKDVPVSRDHDIDAEVTDMQTKMEMKTLYCNLNESSSVDLQKLSEYLTEKDADVVMFVSPVSVNGTDFKTWLKAYAAEQGGLTVLESVDDVASPLTMAALVKDVWSCETYTVKMGATLANPLLHFKANGIHFVVTELSAAKNAIPNDPQSPFITSGIRLGTAAVTTRGFGAEDMKTIARLIKLAATDFENSADYCRAEVDKICDKYPLYA